MNTKSLLIKKHSSIIQCSVKELTLMQRKMINGLIYIAQKNPENEIFETSAEYMKKICGFNLESNGYMQEQLRKIKDIRFEFNYLEKDKTSVWTTFDLLSEVTFEFGSGKIKFAFPPTLRKNILNPAMYAPLNIILIAGLKCSYAIVLYEFLRDYLTSPSVPVMTIKDIRNLLGLKENEYKLFQNFKVRVLNPAIKEVNKNTDIDCHFELIKEEGVRNKYSHIHFFVSKKPGNITYKKKKKENSNISMDLFENVIQIVANPTHKLPEDILSALPDNQKTEVVKELLIQFLEKGNEYNISNIKYSLKNAKDNFPAYLRKALEQDYASHDREVKTKTKIKEEKVIKGKAESEKKVISERNRIEKIRELIRQLPEKEREKLKNRAVNIAKTESPNNEFMLRDSVIELKMASLYMNDHEAREYSTSDQD